MHNWKQRRKISWATFCWKRDENLFFTVDYLNKWWRFILKVASFLIVLSLTTLCKIRGESKRTVYVDGWCTSQTTVFSRWTGITYFKVYRNIVLNNQIDVLKDSFKISMIRWLCRQTLMDKYFWMVYVWSRTSAIKVVIRQHELKQSALEAHSLTTDS